MIPKLHETIHILHNTMIQRRIKIILGTSMSIIMRFATKHMSNHQHHCRTSVSCVLWRTSLQTMVFGVFVKSFFFYTLPPLLLPLLFIEDKIYCFVTFTDYNEEISNRLIYDEERKYGKIPTKIYLLYLKSCGLWTIGVFCSSALVWQAMKIYMDVWLRDWTDIEQMHRFTDVCNTLYIYKFTGGKK